MSDTKKPTILGLKKELDEFKAEVLDILKVALTPKETTVDLTTDTDIMEGGAQDDDKSVKVLPAKYQAIFEEYFDTTDGFTAEMSFENNIEFTIDVPRKFSNATEAHWTGNHADKRNKVLQAGNIEGGIREYCILVAKNLKYDKKLLTK